MRLEQTLGTIAIFLRLCFNWLKKQWQASFPALKIYPSFIDDFLFPAQRPSYLALTFLKIAVIIIGSAWVNLVVAQNPISGHEGFQVLCEGDFTFSGKAQLDGPLGVGGNLILNANGEVAELCKSEKGEHIFPGDGYIITGLLVNKGISWLSGSVKIADEVYLHIGNGTGCIESDKNGGSPTQILPVGASYGNSLRIEGKLDQTPSPAVFQPGSMNFAGLFNTYRATSENLANCINNVQLEDDDGDEIEDNIISNSTKVEINDLNYKVNHLILTQTSLNNIEEIKFDDDGEPDVDRLLVITVVITSDFEWDNPKISGLSGSDAKYILWNFAGSQPSTITIKSSSHLMGTIFAPNHHITKSAKGEISGNIIAKTVSLGEGLIKYYPFEGDVPSCCSNLTTAGIIGSDQTTCGTSYDPSILLEAEAANGGTGNLEYQWQSSTNNVNWVNIPNAASASYDPPTITTTTYFRRGARRYGCSNYVYSNNVAITLNNNPVASITGPNSVCTGNTATLTASGGASYLWDTGASTPSISVTPVATTTYTVTVTESNGCTATASKTVTVNYYPVAIISGVNTICEGMSTLLSATGGGTYEWSDGSSSQNILVSPTSTTTYKVTVTSTGGCTASASNVVTVNPLPNVSITGANQICAGGSTTLTASGGVAYAWSTGSTTASIDVSPANTTEYVVTVTNANGCTATGSRTVTVVGAPTISSHPTGGSICPGQSFSMSVTATGGTQNLSYQWQSSNNNITYSNISGANSSSYTTPALANTTYYRVIVSASGSGCGYVSSNIATVVNVPIPTANAGADFSVCLGASGTLSASGGVGYNWDNGLGSGAVKTINPTVPTTYTVTVSNSLGCTATDQVFVNIAEPVFVNLGVDKTVCNGGSITMTAIGTDGATPYAYHWSHGLGTTNFKTISPNSTQTYSVTVTDAKGCTDVDDIKVTVSAACLENCSNGVDDDSDGLRDCFDMDCACYAPFLCDGKMYHTLRLNNNVSGLGSEGDYILYEVKSNPVALIPIANLNDKGLSGEINSFGFNHNDRFIYGISEDPPYYAYRINANYDVHTLGKITGISNSYGKLWAADFDRNGNYYVIATKTNSNASGPASNQKIYRINLNTLVATEVFNFNEYVGMSDFAFNPVDNKFYGWHGPEHKLVSINPSNWTSTKIGAGNNSYDRMISTFFDSEGSLIAYADKNSNNNNGVASYETLVKINTTTGALTPVGTGLSTDNGDGCSCPYHVRFTKQGPASASGNSVITYNFKIFNQSGLTLNNIVFRDTLPDGYTFVSNAQNVSGGLSFSGDAIDKRMATFTISGIPIGTSSFALNVQVPACVLAGTTLTNQAWLEDFNLMTSALPAIISSDDVSTAIIGDPTVTVINCEICGNGTDDDGDGLIDNNDPDCCTISISAGTDKTICEGSTTTLTATIDMGASGNCSGTSVSTFPYAESFENTLGAWTHSNSDNFNWAVDKSGTPTSGTGPTSGAAGSYYLYVESSSPNYPSKTAIINSPCFDLGNSASASFSFRYHMNGSDIGSLFLEISQDNGSTWTSLWSASGHKGTNWLSQTINLNAYAGKIIKIRFRAITGSGPYGDIAIDNISLTQTTAILAYAWSNGANSPSIVVSPTVSTNYTVTVTRGICSVSDQVFVNVNPKPNAAISGPATVCIGNSGTLTASGGNSYKWSTGATSASIAVAPLLPTTYTVTVTSPGGCTATASHTVSLGVCVENCDNGMDDDGDGLIDCADPNCGGYPTPNAGGDVSVCAGTGAVLSATASGGTAPYSFTWSNGLGNGASKTVFPTNTTTYTVTVTSASGCTATDLVVVNVNSSPVANAGYDIAVCGGTTFGLSASASGGVVPYTFNWSHGLGNGAAKTVSPSATTTYVVTVTGSNGCSNTDQVVVGVNPSPIINAGPDVTICKSFSSTLSATAAGGTAPYTYNWSHGLGVGAIKTVSPSTTTNYSVTVTSANGCVGVDQVVVNVQSCAEVCNNGLDDDGDGFADCADTDCGPQVNLGGNLSICQGQSTSLFASVIGGNGNLTFTWNNGLGSGQSKTVSPSTTTAYSVTVTSQSGCSDVAQVMVTVNVCNENCTNGIDDDADGLVDCDDPDCSGVTAPILMDDDYATCPGMPFSERVTYNDGNLQNPSFSIFTQPSNGSVAIDGTGKFVYTPFGMQCNSDVFVYQVCNAVSGCCAAAKVTLNFGDMTAPVLTNVPPDLTIGCDDVLPVAGIVTAYDQCPGVYIDFEETSDQHYNGACGSYTITRTWTAEDICGNQASKQQKIKVLDQTMPEIFQVYTLENGSRIVAGTAQRVTHDWKYVPFPITFSETPIVFTTVASTTDVSAVTIQTRNVYTQGFQIRLREEEAADGIHVNEKVAWVAIEPSSQSGDFNFQAGTLANFGHEWDTLAFSQLFSEPPLLFTAMQTAKESDAATVRCQYIDHASAAFKAQEETSHDAETSHQNETLGIMAIGQGSSMVDEKGRRFGETGLLNLTNAWATVNLSGNFTKPVVIVSGLTNHDSEPVNIRLRNITSNSFQIRLQEWDYLDGNHGAESVSWMVVEGSIPGNGGYYCSGNAAELRPNLNVFAIDNCDELVSFGYDESASAQTGTGLLTVRTWTASDDCGNTNLVSRYDTCAAAAVQVKAMLFGAMLSNGGGDNMRDNLRQQNRVPVFEPYSELPGFPHIDYGEHGTIPQDGGATSQPDEVTICHKHGTSEAAILSIPVSELALHLSHGDIIGDCGSGNTGLVTICHKPGTPAQSTLVLPQSAVLAHLAYGDVLGSCSTSSSDLPADAANAQYRTINDGSWSMASTWKNGNVPPTDISNKSISIEHKVVIEDSDLKLNNNSKLWVTHGSLTLESGNFKIEKSQAVFSQSVLDMSSAGNIEIKESQGMLNFKDCYVTAKQNVKNDGGSLKFENVNLAIGGNFENKGGKDTLINVCAVVEGNFKSDSPANNYFYKVKLRMLNGNFENDFGSSITGDSTILLIENGVLQSLGTWLGSITQHCVSGSVLGLVTNILQGPEDCVDIANFFNPCNCFDESEDSATPNNTGIGASTALEDDYTMNAGRSFGGGSIEPAVLEITGDDAIVDWMVLELRDAADVEEILGYSTVLVQRDGDIVSENQDSVIVFPGLGEGHYYIAIRHRNHLGLMTDIPFFLSTQNTPEIDFTDPALPVRGGNYAGRMHNGKRTMWSGDFNQDGKIIYQGPYNDIFHLFSRVLADSGNSDILANYIVLGYELQDYNLDGKVIFQGPGNDKAPMLYNSILSHPANNSLLANYIAKSWIP